MKAKVKYSEEELVRLLKAKDENAFSVLYSNYSKALYGIINKIIADEEESEDVLQNVFLKIWNNFSVYDPAKGRIFTWMLNIARNAAIDLKRSASQNAQHKIRLTDNIVSEIDYEHQHPASYDHIGLKSEVDKLKTDHRQLIDLVYYNGYTQEEISKTLKMPLGTVKTKVRQAIQILRTKIYN